MIELASIRGKRGVDRHPPDTREIPRADGSDIVKELERILQNQRVLDSLTSPGELHVAVACLSASTQTEVAEKPAMPVGRPRLVDAARQTPNYTSSSTQVDLDVAEERASADHMEWFTDAMEECTTDGREWLKACDTEDMTRETTADENEEANGTDVESSIVLTTLFNPDLYKGVNFF